ncbi:hypothetical protein [Shewanella psychrotolerans]|uniref:hypothetical protein n=1 Tax=Shewanella psychrotolerans TaxID=2864206 RepID=UPI001C65527A|nr:hypothetical protein [Shewanella psychrotolerans]QYK00624.1 hypothetical protein K0I62_14660 [Shewanella psychrotolerans]
MITRSIYEVLPTSYLILGSSTIALNQEAIAVSLALVVFILGAKIYNMRSQNRRTDPSKKRKHGMLPLAIYNFVPFIYILSSMLVFRFANSALVSSIGIALLCYALYILMQRASYRRHLQPQSHRFF